ncbi:MAG TPA: hypothetical protein VFW08_07420 [bacterium]|nr:hypothetical protein [bacterium]
MLKVHINVKHLASGTVFGSLAEERSRLEEILAVGLPTGLVPGEEQMLPAEEIPEIRRLGFAFLDAFIETIKPHLYDAGIPVIPALPHSADDRHVGKARDLPGEWVEAAIVPAEGYGKPPEQGDYEALRRVGETTRKKLIVPTQRAVAPDDAGRYFDIAQVAALMIGAIVTGTDPRSLGAATKRFRRALDRISPWR